MSDRVRHHPPELIALLLGWCAANARTRAAEVLAVGLAYVHGLNRHQLAHAVITQAGDAVTVRYPLARRVAEIRRAAYAELTLDAPDWLAGAAGSATAGAEPGTLLFRKRGIVRVPVNPQVIDRLVGQAGAEATGCQISVQSLNSSRVAAVRAAGTPLALHEIGYSPRWAARLTQARTTLILPEKVG